ncbi:hypothetical protein [Limimaricola pyoseonensis]|uniref:Uncharacterized protein n=1 Tax=Limimaricola pyoseonensis TaxID=521013 RepID=A0A1G7JGK4_9RHOB|nr:hypothetical protein [Limimaricola pyoseonensis]SDF24082.1 hypothetical protein SAMN04488567_3717 [Limimaricola pyoseonensis]
MHPDTATARRALLRAYLAYIKADEDWRRGVEEAARLWPDVRRRSVREIGAPGSRLRRLVEIRQHSVEVLTVMQAKHHRAVLRLGGGRLRPAELPPPTA